MGYFSQRQSNARYSTDMTANPGRRVVCTLSTGTVVTHNNSMFLLPITYLYSIFSCSLFVSASDARWWAVFAANIGLVIYRNFRWTFNRDVVATLARSRHLRPTQRIFPSEIIERKHIRNKKPIHVRLSKTDFECGQQLIMPFFILFLSILYRLQMKTV